MSMRLLITLTIFIYIDLWGQAPDTLYLDTLYNEVESKLNAKYIRVISDYDSSIDRFNAFDLNENGQKIFEGQVRFINSSFPDGSYLYYFDNGTVRLKGNNRNTHDKNFEFEEELWHPNGVRQGNTSFKKQYQIHNHFDTLGRQEVNTGHGQCNFISYFDKTVHKGQVINGRKEGTWNIYDFKGTLTARENYRDGNLVKGFKIKSEIDSIPYKHFGLGDDVMITNKIEREIKKLIKGQLTKKLNQNKEIFYTIHVKDNKIINVQLLRDKFIIDNNIKLTSFLADKKYIVTIQGEPVDDIVLPLKFKMRV
jgi:antitoxin component YwqK of YwqJK toxin-antitoxin module